MDSPQNSDQLREELGTPRPSESLRETWRQKGRESTYFMGKAIVGFKDLTPDLHGMMAQWIQRPTKRKLGLAPRDHLKTSVWTIADSLRRVAQNPEIRILITNEALSNARNMLSKIESVPEKCEIFRWLYPELIPDFSHTRWNQDAAEFPRKTDYPEATIEVIGVGGASTSRHYNLIKEDDLVGREAYESAAVMAKAIDQHKLAESLLNSPTDEIQTVGTRWHIKDLVRWMYDHEPELDHLCLSIRRPEGDPIWPGRFTDAYIEQLRIKYGAAMFALQYENRAIAEGITEFSRDWLRYWHQTDDETIVLERPSYEGGPLEVKLNEMDVYETFDPGFTPETSQCRSAIVSCGFTAHTPFNLVVLDAIGRFITPKKALEVAHDVWERRNPITCGVEVVGGQQTFFYWIPTVYPTMGIRRLKTDTHKSKTTRIRTLSPYGEQGRIYVHRQHTDLLEEWESFGEKTGSLRDILDALAYQLQIGSSPTDSGPSADENEEDLEDLIEEAISGRSEITGY